MRNPVQRLRYTIIIQAICVAILASGLPLTGADPLPVTRPEKALAGKQWRVKYMGGPERLKRGARVTLSVTGPVIKYWQGNSRSGRQFSIPVAAVTDVSDAVIEGNRAEEVFGPDEPDYVSSCESVRDPVAFQLCLDGGIALETPFAIIASVLSNIPFKDRFVRVAWQREEKAAVVFKVSGRESAGLLEELQTVTGRRQTQGELDQAKAKAMSILSARPQLSWRITHTGLSPSGTVGYGRCPLLASDTLEYRENCTREALKPEPPQL